MAKSSAKFDHKVVLYEFRPSRSERVLWAAYELGLDEHVTLKRVSFDPNDPEFENLSEVRKLNPMGQVPTMVLTAPDGQQMVSSQSVALTHTLAEIGGGLTPEMENVFGRSQYHRMMSFANSELDNAVIAVYENMHVYKGKDNEKEMASRKTFDEKIAKVLESILENNGNPVKWICEPYHEGFTAADIAIAFGLWVGDYVDMLKGHPVLKKYLQRCTEREAWVRIKKGSER